ncbi:MAG: hypothetical protein PHY08_11810 [Candidatus Cloacimonetes bacterium]|jgi:acyl carrier protein|nr:hypothetical protein [Candidatus Cloacimonadota bacterium]
MTIKEVESVVISVLKEYCEVNSIEVDITNNTALIGSNRILDSMGLVNYIVDVETTFLDKGIDVSLTSEAAMSLRISPFRSVGSLSNYILRLIETSDNG